MELPFPGKGWETTSLLFLKSRVFFFFKIEAKQGFSDCQVHSLREMIIYCVGGHVFMVDMFSPQKFNVNEVYV